MKKILITPILFLFAVAGYSQFTLDAQLRPRAEYRHGYIKLSEPGAKPAFSISQRTRLNAGYSDEKFSFYLSLQDVRTWGNESQLNPTDNWLSVHQAWAVYNFSEFLSMKLGRQEIIYDDSRIFGNVDWAQQGRSHDALLFKFNKNDWKADLGLAYNQDGQNLFGTTYTVKNNYKTMQYLWVNKKIKKFAFSILVLNNGLQYSNVIDSVTTEFKTVYNQNIGTRLTYGTGRFKFAGAVYFQMGKDIKDIDLNAQYYALDVNVKVTDPFNIAAGFEYLSGTDQDASDNTNRSFTPWYGTNHKFNGFMDYFYVGSWVNSVGLQDYYLKFVYKKGKWNGLVAGHYFASAANIMDPENPGTNLDNNLGTEVDLVLGYTMAENVKVLAGYSQMFATTSMEAMKGGSKDETNNWAWLMIVFNPKLVK